MYHVSGARYYYNPKRINYSVLYAKHCIYVRTSTDNTKVDFFDYIPSLQYILAIEKFISTLGNIDEMFNIFFLF